MGPGTARAPQGEATSAVFGGLLAPLGDHIPRHIPLDALPEQGRQEGRERGTWGTQEGAEGLSPLTSGSLGSAEALEGRAPTAQGLEPRDSGLGRRFGPNLGVQQKAEGKQEQIQAGKTGLAGGPRKQMC